MLAFISATGAKTGPRGQVLYLGSHSYLLWWHSSQPLSGSYDKFSFYLLSTFIRDSLSNCPTVWFQDLLVTYDVSLSALCSVCLMFNDHTSVIKVLIRNNGDKAQCTGSAPLLCYRSGLIDSALIAYVLFLFHFYVSLIVFFFLITNLVIYYQLVFSISTLHVLLLVWTHLKLSWSLLSDLSI